MSEIWKLLPETLNFSNYKVSNLGNVKNIKTDKILNNKPRKSGYVNIKIVNDSGIRKSCKAHRLVAFAFIANPENKPHVDHINNIKHDNNLNNLRWATISENNLNKSFTNNGKGLKRKVDQYTLEKEYIRTWNSIIDPANGTGIHKSGIRQCCSGKYSKSKGFIWKYHEDIIDGEIWKSSNIHPGYKVSNMGRVEFESGRITYGTKELNDYRVVNICGNRYRVHRLIMMIFNPKDNMKNLFVNHIDEKPSNNKLDNLEWATNQENIVHSQGIPIIQLTKDGKYINEFPFIMDASNKTNLDPSAIVKVCKGKSNTCGGYVWKYKTDYI